jgi:exodeoxyribonuclease-5
LNQQQTNALEILLDFEKGTKRTCCLEGYAGTGKTTVLNTYIQQSSVRNIAVSAPTHIAKQVIETITQKQGLTIQSLLGLRPDINIENYDYNKPEFKEIGEPKISNYSLVIIDECSMLNASIVKRIVKIAEQFRTKIIFVGDSLQLPPIKEKLSISFTAVDVKISLTEIVRQTETNSIKYVAGLFRNDILNGTQEGFKYLSENPDGLIDGEGYRVMTDRNELADIVNQFYNSFEYTEFGSTRWIKYLAYTNKTVTKFNQYVRPRLYTNPSLLEVNELLIGYKTISIQIPYSDDRITPVYNSRQYRVLNPKTVTSPYDLQCENIDIEADGLINNINIVRPESYESFVVIFNQLLSNALSNRTKFRDFYAFKNTHVLLTNIDNVNDFNYYNKPTVITKDIDYGYGVTVHKSQGSTYYHTIINGLDIKTCRISTDMKKLFYVALTRASHSTHILL